MRVKSNNRIEKEIGRRLKMIEMGLLNRLRILILKEQFEGKHIIAGRTNSEILQQKDIECQLKSIGINWRY